MSNKYLRNKLIAFAIILISIILDQATKVIAVRGLNDTGIKSVELIKGVLSLNYTTNPGALAGMFSDSRWVFMSISTIAIFAILVYLFFFKEENVITVVSLALILGGGIGNMIDRIVQGYVVDFIYFSLIDFPVFNFADICVSCGSFLLLFYLIFSFKKGDLQGTT